MGAQLIMRSYSKKFDIIEIILKIYTSKHEMKKARTIFLTFKSITLSSSAIILRSPKGFL